MNTWNLSMRSVVQDGRARSGMQRDWLPMQRLKQLLRLLLAVAAAAQLTACSKSIQWEEEVPLNTGETIWVKRTDTFTRGSEPGNPLKSAWWPKSRALEFTWQGRLYTYQSDSKVSVGAILIYPLVADKTLAIVDATSNCAKPGYGEFRWAKGRWQLQQNVNQVLIGQPRNLMSYYSAEDGAVPARVTKEIRNTKDTAPNRGRTDLTLDASRIATNCLGSK